MSHLAIRGIQPRDTSRVNEIYNMYIVGSHVSFDTEAWTDEVRKKWLDDKIDSGYPILVAEIDGLVVGAAWAGPWRDKKAYSDSTETTVVFDSDYTGEGTGTVLYAELIEELRKRGFHRAYAIIALPNDASIALHRKLGYTEIGVLDEAGFKDDQYVSTMLMERRLETPT
jgi:phosphinothricin acetyltransferase